MNPSMLTRLQTEYDCFFFRAVLCIFSSRRLGAWQYLAAIPYRIVSLSTLWQVFYILHTDSVPNDLLNSDNDMGKKLLFQLLMIKIKFVGLTKN